MSICFWRAHLPHNHPKLAGPECRAPPRPRPARKQRGPRRTGVPRQRPWPPAPVPCRCLCRAKPAVDDDRTASRDGGHDFGEALDRSAPAVFFTAAVVGYPDTVSTMLDCKFSIFSGHDAFYEHLHGRRVLEPSSRNPKSGRGLDLGRTDGRGRSHGRVPEGWKPDRQEPACVSPSFGIRVWHVAQNAGFARRTRTNPSRFSAFPGSTVHADRRTACRFGTLEHSQRLGSNHGSGTTETKWARRGRQLHPRLV